MVQQFQKSFDLVATCFKLFDEQLIHSEEASMSITVLVIRYESIHTYIAQVKYIRINMDVYIVPTYLAQSSDKAHWHRQSTPHAS